MFFLRPTPSAYRAPFARLYNSIQPTLQPQDVNRYHSLIQRINSPDGETWFVGVLGLLSSRPHSTTLPPLLNPVNFSADPVYTNTREWELRSGSWSYFFVLGKTTSPLLQSSPFQSHPSLFSMILKSSLVFFPRPNRPKSDTTRSAKFQFVAPVGSHICPSLSRRISLTEVTALIAFLASSWSADSPG
jgi:hypothetical protein